MGGIGKYLFDQMTKYFDCGGIQVSPEHEEARKKICDTCEYNGKVIPANYLPKVEGCEVCQCPFALKRRQLKYYRIKGEENRPLTKKEIAEILLYKGTDRTKLITITCPHPDGNKWTETDSNHLK